MALSENVQKLWQSWDVRVFILISLFIQFFLLFFAPFRKRTKSKVFMSSIWLAYLAADWVATFAVGLILDGSVSPSIDANLLVYWAPFLLVHLGGPDTITAFSFEDNELWARHLLEFLVQMATTGYLFYQSLSLHSNKLLAPTVLIYLAGIIKYGERIRSLYLASLSTFQDTLSKRDHQEWGENPVLDKIDSRSSSDHTSGRCCSDLHERLVTDAFFLFKFFQKTPFDSNFTAFQRIKIQNYFMDIKSAGEAFRIIEIELNLFYEVLYTKIIAFHQWLGYGLRVVSFSAIFISLVLWHVTVDKSHLHKIDVKITYTLIIGALAMDIIAFIGLASSDWMIGSLGLDINMQARNEGGSSSSYMIKAKGIALKTVVLLKSLTWSAYNSSSHNSSSSGNNSTCQEIIRLPQKILGMLFYRWSRTISQASLDIESSKTSIVCLDSLVNWSFSDDRPRVWTLRFSNDLMNLIFDEVRKKTPDACTSGGLGSNDPVYCISLNGQVPTRNYDECLLVWYYVTTKILDGPCYVSDSEHVEHCRVLSHYMVYLIKDQSILMSTVGGMGRRRVLQTCKMLRKIHNGDESVLKSSEELSKQSTLPPELSEYLHEHLVTYLEKKKVEDLIDELNKKGEEKWEITSKKWVELLCYAAIECGPRDLIAQVSQGGELITFVWALLTHFGLGKQ